MMSCIKDRRSRVTSCCSKDPCEYTDNLELLVVHEVSTSVEGQLYHLNKLSTALCAVSYPCT